MTKRSISIDELDRLGIDSETGQLFWDDKEVVTSMSLPRWVQISALVTAFSTGVLALTSVIPIILAALKALP